jgi:hypothetical protein
MLCRVACSKSGTVLGTTGNGLDEAKEAGVLIEKAKYRLDKNDAELTASVYLAEGIWYSVMAYKGKSVKDSRVAMAHHAQNKCL